MSGPDSMPMPTPSRAPRYGDNQAPKPLVARVVIVDNYDSFTHNFYQALRVLGAQVEIVRNDETTVEAVADANFDGVVLSPGPCTPDEAGITLELAKRLAGTVPLLGVCLGHQAIAQAFGAEIVRAKRPRHGHASLVRHDGGGSLGAVPSPFEAARYHSLVVDEATLPARFERTAISVDDGALMAFFDRERDVEGLQFHPESMLTPVGLSIVGAWIARIANAERSCS